MRTFDLSPLMRSSIGFDHLSRLMDAAMRADTSPAYPPYNIEKLNDDDYRIAMAVAGFTEDELNITVTDGTLVITGSASDDEDEGERYLHRGIAKRAFERRFQLAETIEVGSASYENGLLSVELKRVVPEHLKPREVSINGKTKGAKVIDHKAA